MKSQGNHSMQVKRGHEEEHKGLISQPETGCTAQKKSMQVKTFRVGLTRIKVGKTESKTKARNNRKLTFNVKQEVTKRQTHKNIINKTPKIRDTKA